MKAVLLRLQSSDIHDLSSWVPAGDFGIIVQLIVGPDSGHGEESFDITVCTTGWLAERVKALGIFEGRHHLIIDNYDYCRIEQYLCSRISEFEDDSWQGLANKITRIGHWEFEDYHE